DRYGQRTGHAGHDADDTAHAAEGMRDAVIIERALLREGDTARGEHTEAAERLRVVARYRMKVIAAGEDHGVANCDGQVIGYKGEAVDSNKIRGRRSGSDDAEQRHSPGEGAQHLFHRLSLRERHEVGREFPEGLNKRGLLSG